MKIKFVPDSEFAEKFIDPPKPAKHYIPDWYKSTEFLIKGYDNYTLSTPTGVPSATIKGCNPFLDGLTAGYVYCLPADLEIHKGAEKLYTFHWRTENELVTEHSLEQHPKLPATFQGQNAVFKFYNEFVIETPPGYSTYFTHPVNRHNLPFRLFSGVVETDTYKNPVQFPFQLLNQTNEVTILKKGTPICQFFPFKRDSWRSEVGQYSEDYNRKNAFDYRSVIYRAYKKLHWVKKRFD